jgi:hypothetical protein
MKELPDADKFRMLKTEDDNGHRTVEITFYKSSFVDGRDPDCSRAEKDICTFRLGLKDKEKFDAAFIFLDGKTNTIPFEKVAHLRS